MHLVIVAGGLGSRLAPLTNHIPKFLVNIGKETGFVEQIRYWADYNPDSITVIVHSDYKDLVKAYYDLYFKDDPKLQVHIATQDPDGGYSDEDFVRTPFHVKTVDVANGSAHAIMTSCDHLINQPVMFMWCDVMPGAPLNMEDLNFGGPIAYLNYDHPNRYDLVQVGKGWAHRAPAIRPDGRGGIFGMYYLSTYRPKPFNDGQDFVEILTQYSADGYVGGLEIPKIIDWGDKPKLERTRETADGARSFNYVQMHGDLVLKGALRTQGVPLIQREIMWYDELTRMNCKVNRPQHWVSQDHTSFVMSKVQGVPVWQLWPSLDAEGRALVLSRLFEQLDQLHEHKILVGNAVIQADIKVEAYDKLIKRYDEIEAVIKAFGPITVVNGIPLEIHDPRETIERLYNELALCYSSVEHNSLIHGDLQMSNSMINPDTLEVTLIDPRGYFGHSVTYGLADYDFAKLRYSLSGYDLFNYSREFHISKPEHDHICFTIPQPDLTGTGKLNQRFGWAHELWLAVCWIGLAQYIKNDPVKSVAAHYHGLQLAERTMGC